MINRIVQNVQPRVVTVHYYFEYIYFYLRFICSKKHNSSQFSNRFVRYMFTNEKLNKKMNVQTLCNIIIFRNC